MVIRSSPIDADDEEIVSFSSLEDDFRTGGEDDTEVDDIRNGDEVVVRLPLLPFTPRFNDRG
jgi:hypothetical protein